MRRLVIVVLAVVTIAMGCGGGSIATGATAPDTPGEAEGNAATARTTLEERTVVFADEFNFELGPVQTLVKLSGAARDLQLACRGFRCVVVWSDERGVQMLSYVRERGSKEPEWNTRELATAADAHLTCRRLRSYDIDGWAALVTGRKESKEYPAILVFNDVGYVTSRILLPESTGEVVDADFLVRDDTALIALDVKNGVYALEVDLANGSVGDAHKLSGDTKSTTSQVLWAHDTFWVTWHAWPRHQSPTLHAARWDTRATVDLPYLSDHSLQCRKDHCIVAGESPDRTLTVAPIDLLTGELGPSSMKVAPIGGDPYAETSLLGFFSGHLVIAPRAWSNEAQLLIFAGSGEPVASPKLVNGLIGPPYAAKSGETEPAGEGYRWNYAAAKISPPADYEPVDSDGPNGEILTSLPDSMELRFQEFSVVQSLEQ